MVNDNGNQFKNISDNIPVIKKYYSLFFILIEQFLIGCNPDWNIFGKREKKNTKNATNVLHLHQKNSGTKMKTIFLKNKFLF